MEVGPLLDELIRHDPRRFAGCALDVLATASGARAAAVLTLVSGAPAPFVACRLSGEDLTWLVDATTSYADALEQGQPVLVEGRVLVPLSRKGPRAYVYVDSERAPLALIESFAQVFADAASSNGAPPRDPLLTALRDSEWRVDRAARRLGITRATLYSRLAGNGSRRSPTS